MRGTDRQHHVHVTELGEPGGFSVWPSTPQARRPAHACRCGRRQGATTSTSPAAVKSSRLHDPDGRKIEVVFGMTELEPLVIVDHPPLNTGASAPALEPCNACGRGRRRSSVAVMPRSRPPISTFSGAGTAPSRTARLRRHVHRGAGTSARTLCALRPRRSPASHHTLLFLEMGEAKLGHVAWKWPTSTISWSDMTIL